MYASVFAGPPIRHILKIGRISNTEMNAFFGTSVIWELNSLSLGAILKYSPLYFTMTIRFLFSMYKLQVFFFKHNSTNPLFVQCARLGQLEARVLCLTVERVLLAAVYALSGLGAVQVNEDSIRVGQHWSFVFCACNIWEMPNVVAKNILFCVRISSRK